MGREPAEAASTQIAVIKIGGSILTGPISYHRAAKFIERRLDADAAEKLAVVVSARNGVTDFLLQEAQAIEPEPSSAALDLLWSTGELHSVAVLALHLQAIGIPATPLNVEQTGLHLPRRGVAAAQAEFEPVRIHAALESARVAIVPGFLAVNPAGAIVTLGRGGSDLTAVLLAAGLGASRCELVKDVPGYFSDDPHRDAHARHLPALSFAQALVMADAGCDLVQRHALIAAQQHNLPLVVRSLEEGAPESWISAKPLTEPDRAAQAEA